MRSSDAPDLAELIAIACTQTAAEETTPLACPELPSRRLELPRFSGITLADVVLQPRAPAPAAGPAPTHARTKTPSLAAPLPPAPRVLLGPGAMTMTLAIVATLMFGVAVAAQVH